jgi:hypothetical protein
MELRPLRIYMRPQFVIFVAAGEAGHECPRLHKSPKHSKLMGTVYLALLVDTCLLQDGC